MTSDTGFRVKAFLKSLLVTSPTAALICILSPPLFLAQSIDILDNQKVADLVKSGFGDAVLIGKIRQSRVLLDASTNGLMQLKEAGVSDVVIGSY